ncbi:MAG TPA: prepilin-type N-terminal cleavage/methylation domain-containing protein [Candidatus Binatia bacterium]|nr:prepilin-type N-terminal cleavage/methylation domain-containing protein [Candidatus Binatia bacterium]
MRRRLGAAVHGDRGFTLVEVVLSIALFAVLVGILYGSFYLSERAATKAAARADASQSLRTFEEVLGGYIRSAYPYRSNPRDQAVYFTGDDRGVEFISSLSTGLGGRGMSRVRISAELEGNRGATLILEEEMPVRVGDKEMGGGGYRNNILLAQGLSGLRFEYLDPGTDPQKPEETWVDEWDGKQKRALPRAVRLVYRGERGDVRWTFPVMMRVLAPQ